MPSAGISGKVVWAGSLDRGLGCWPGSSGDVGGRHSACRRERRGEDGGGEAEEEEAERVGGRRPELGPGYGWWSESAVVL